MEKIYGCKKVEKISWFCNFSYFKIVRLQKLKGLQYSKLGMWEGYHLSMEGIQKEYLLY